jgi:flagellin
MPIENINAINSALSSNRTARLLYDSTLQLQKSIMRFSSGLRSTSPSDDAARLSQLVNLQSQVRRISAAAVNTDNALSFIQTQEGFLSQTQAALARMSELSVLAQDATKNDADRATLQTEFGHLQKFVEHVTTAEFNGVPLFSETALHVTSGANGETVQMASIDLTVSGEDGGVGDVSGLSISTSGNAEISEETVNTAIGNVATLLAHTSSNIQYLSAISNTLDVTQASLSATASAIADVDAATESARLSNLKVRVEGGAMQLGMANRAPKSILELLVTRAAEHSSSVSPS